MNTVKYKEFDISVEKYSFSDTCNLWSYYICTISNSDDCYSMVFNADGLTEDETLEQCKRRLDYKNDFSVKFTISNIYTFIIFYRWEIDKLNTNFDVEIRKV